MKFLHVNNFVVLDSVYGKFVVNRHCDWQADHLVKFGVPHIEAELGGILGILGTLPQGCVTVDAGANIGLVAIPMAQAIKDKGGVVHAFEIQRMLFYALCAGAVLNDLENLYAHHKGVGAAPTRLMMRMADYSKQQDLGLYSLVTPIDNLIHQKQNAPDEEIEIVAVDDLNLPRLDFLKIDVEGMDIDVLKGARRALHDFHPWCWIEHWGVNIADIKAQFAGLPYRFFVINERDMLCAPAERAANITINAKEV